MVNISLGSSTAQLARNAAAGGQALEAADQARNLQNKKKEDGELREAFDGFVGETFFGQMLQSMRKTVGKQDYFYGGRAEEIFRGQLDQQLAQEMTKASADTFSGPMFDLFMMSRK
jgi:flagellar protein FlgJ